MAKKTAKKKTGKKMGKKSGKKSKKKGRPASASNAPHTPWFDAAKGKPLISEYAQRLQGYIDTMADGQVSQRELQAQEERLVASMKDVEPRLPPRIHEKITRLLCEMAAYDMMQALNAVHAARPKTVFRG